MGNYSSGFLRAQVIFGSTGTRTSGFQIIRLLPLQLKGLEAEKSERDTLIQSFWKTLQKTHSSELLILVAFSKVF